MGRKDSFAAFHPLVNFLYFALVLLFAMFFKHPVSLAASFLCAILYAAELQGWRKALGSVLALLPLILFAAVLNPAFNHQGVTILCYLPTGNPLTGESILYGFAAAVMLGSVILWFTCCTAVLTSDKFIYLFGRVLPAVSLILSMTLRFVPRFRTQLQAVREAQRGMGRDITGKLSVQIKNAAAILSALITWSLENAVEMADSMKSRGYGLSGRTAFSIYHFERRDWLLLGWLLLCAVYICYGWFEGALRWQYFPVFGGQLALSYQMIYLALCLTPVMLARKEEYLWKRLRSGI